MSLVRKVDRDRHWSHPSGPNISIELNYWHAGVLAGFLQEFEAAAGSLMEHQLYPGVMTHAWSEKAVAELFLNLKRVLDE